MEKKLSSKEMLRDITSMRSRANELLKEGKNYHTLLATLTEKSYYYDDSLELPSVKELAELTGLKYDLVRRQLRQIYDDLVLDDENSKPFHFRKINYIFRLEGFKNSLWHEVDSLPIIPRIGENISIPFFRAYLGVEYFYVADVQHVFQDDLQTVEIILKEGWYNLYWHYRKDKAKEEEELFWRDFFDLDDYQLKKKLNIK